MTPRRALGDHDVDYTFDDPDNGWFGHNPAVDPMSARDDAGPPDVPPEDDAPDTDRWPVATVDTTPVPEVAEDARVEAPENDLPERAQPGGRDATRWAGVATPRHGRVGTPTESSWESRLSGSGAWDFKVSASSPRHHSRFAVLALVAAVLAVIGVVLLLRTPAPAADEPTVVTPNQSTAQPAPTSAAPALSATSDAPLPPGPPAPPPPGPPPPPPTAEQINPPDATRVYTPRRQSPSDESNKPQINVTRMPTPNAPTKAPGVSGPKPWGWQ